MSNNSVNKRYVPKLRFKGFEREYKEIKISDVSEFYKGDGYSKKDIIDNGKYEVILYGDLFTTYKNNIEEIKYKTNRIGNKKTRNNSILFPGSSTSLNDFFPCCSIKKEVFAGSDLNIFELNINEDSLYYSYCFSKPYHLKNIFRLTEGSTINHLYGKYISEYKLIVPVQLIEQEEISSFFNLLDKQISLLENKLELTEQIKDWIIEFLYKKAKQNKKIRLSEILVPRIVGHIIDLKGYTPISIMLHGKGFKENTLNVKLTKKGRKYYERFSGDLIIGLQNFHNGSIDILNDEYNKPIMSNAIASFINKSEYPLIIIKYILLSKKHQQYLINIAEGTGQKEFTINKILNSYIWIPTHDLIEKFSKFIKTLELQIRNLQIKKDFLEKNKKYYLDNLFI